MIKPVVSNRNVHIIIAAAGGAIAGFVVYIISRIKGQNLYIIIGAVVAAAAVFVWEYYRRRVQLTGVKITVPQVSELTFTVNDDARLVAWRLYVETATRVSTQALADEDGFIRETLTSLYGLFATTRDLLKAGRPSLPVSGSPTVENLAVVMLNRELRPFLSKWHPRLRQYEKVNPDAFESAWPEILACRNELRITQEHLAIFTLAFAKLAGVSDAESTIAAASRDT
jgi:hypothetical protein